jgi:hypothetical protein
MRLSKSEMSARRDALFDMWARRDANPHDPLPFPEEEVLPSLGMAPGQTSSRTIQPLQTFDVALDAAPDIAFLAADDMFTFL